MGVSSLGYMVLNVTDVPGWQVLLEQVFGLEPRQREGSGAIDYRLDDYHHRLTLSPASEDSVETIGWEVSSMARLDALVSALRAQGIEVTRGDDALCARRKVKAIYTFYEQWTMQQTELFYGPLASSTAFTPRRGISGYKTGNLGLGHVVYWVGDLQKANDFYCDVMGFSVTDYIAWDDNDAVFYHCNSRHHTLALMQAAPGRPAGRFNHLMLEANSLDDVGYGYDIVRDLEIPVVFEPGKHSNDHMQSFYLATPSGFMMEYGYGGRDVGPDWEVRNYDAPMLWGHRPASA